MNEWLIPWPHIGYWLNLGLRSVMVGERIAFMTAWAKAVPSMHEPHDVELVFNIAEASRETNGNAQQLCRDASRGYANYLWKERAYGSHWVAEGTEK